VDKVFRFVKRFSITKTIQEWLVWQKSPTRPSIRSARRRKPKKLLPTKRHHQRVKRRKKIVARNPYKDPEKWKRQLRVVFSRTMAGLAMGWLSYETWMAILLVE